MTTFARIESGIAFDPVVAASAEAAKAIFGPIADAWVFTLVPDGTKHGARDNGDGTFTNPIPRAVEPTYSSLSKVQFQDLCVVQLGGDATGRARYVSVMNQIKASTNPDTAFSYERYLAANALERDDVAVFLTLLVADPQNDLTEQEKDLIIASWPASTG